LPQVINKRAPGNVGSQLEESRIKTERFERKGWGTEKSGKCQRFLEKQKRVIRGKTIEEIAGVLGKRKAQGARKGGKKTKRREGRRAIK